MCTNPVTYVLSLFSALVVKFIRLDVFLCLSQGSILVGVTCVVLVWSGTFLMGAVLGSLFKLYYHLKSKGLFFVGLVLD